MFSSHLFAGSPHGGYLKPGTIPLRDAGCYINGDCVWSHTCGTKDATKCKAKNVGDAYTQEITRAVADALETKYGCRPYVIINLLHRGRLDANREKPEATFGVAEAEAAWDEFHRRFNDSKRAIGIGTRALFIEIHGVGKKVHTEQWVEVGYTISKSKLDSGGFTPSDSSIRHLATLYPDADFDYILRGFGSMGELFRKRGYDVIPSPDHPSPNGANYFIGGYDVRIHGSKYGGVVDAIQIELPRDLREPAIYPTFSPILADIIHEFWQMYNYP